MTDLIDGFIELFQGNDTAIGTEDGGSWRPSDRDSWKSQIHGHLEGFGPPVGVYPMVLMGNWLTEGTRWGVRWGCVDFDEGEEASWAYACNTQAVLRECEITSWIERSRSKGYHVWVFTSPWVEAVDMRRALLGACQIVDAPQKEINPKQTELREGQLGNYVRLPYPGWLRTDGSTPDRILRRVMVDNSGYAHALSWFVEEALQSRATPEQIRDVGHALYTEPPKRQRRQAPPSDMDGDPIRRMSGLAWKIFQDGPLDGMGRGHTLYKLACQLYEDGKHTAEEAEALCVDADSRWGKFVDRGDEHMITRMIDKIWEEA